MDRDFDGKLSFEEFMGEETPLERLFHSMDKDGDGAVTQEVENIGIDIGVKLKRKIPLVPMGVLAPRSVHP